MSKVSMPRPRYVAFRVEAARPVSRRALQVALRERAKAGGVQALDALQLTRYEFPHGIVRVPHAELALCRALLGRVVSVQEGTALLPVRLEPLSTSGTLKALTGRLGLLRERGAPEGAPARPAARSRGDG